MPGKASSLFFGVKKLTRNLYTLGENPSFSPFLWTLRETLLSKSRHNLLGDLFQFAPVTDNSTVCHEFLDQFELRN